MKASVEISMYPLDAGYGTPILKFISRLRQHAGLTVQSNNMSTQIFGEYDLLMAILTQEMKHSFEEEKTVVMVMKVVNLDLNG
jgi:uncharacterized protein YqgV (UPF0045/DUF77 family)